MKEGIKGVITVNVWSDHTDDLVEAIQMICCDMGYSADVYKLNI